MGLFGNRNTDDYVSPFDVDEAPDYVDPSTVVERESQIDARQHQREERRRKAQKRANALRNIVIPGFEHDIKFISDALEEKEREEFSRQKVIKNNKQKQAVE